ncbi:MAG: hypothetical protein JWQ34_1279 [Mucilaginibacter sp.]|nr:hypothetical protein [Mucilaginibacter sp.]MDB5003054.1 hypothetical protein [Mucilaginibacter sp.]
MKNGDGDSAIYAKYNPGSDSGISTNYISGNSKAIYNTIVEYFNNYK